MVHKYTISVFCAESPKGFNVSQVGFVLLVIFRQRYKIQVAILPKESLLIGQKRIFPRSAALKMGCQEDQPIVGDIQMVG